MTIEEIKQTFTEDIATIADRGSLAELKNKYLGKKGKLRAIQQQSNFAEMSPDERRAAGQKFNEIKVWVEQAIKKRLVQLDEARFQEASQIDFDLTAPVEPASRGNIHPVSMIQMELESIFTGMGFMVDMGREVEEEYYNFDALNIPGDHPAREM